MRAGVGEADLQSRVARKLLQHLRAMIGNRCAPTYCGPVLEHQIEERVHRVQPAALQAYLPERLADHRRVRAGDDLSVEEVTMPGPGRVLGVVVLPEPAPVGLVPQ